MKTQAKILVVEDDAPQRLTLVGFLKKRGYLVEEAASAEQAKKILKQEEVDLLLTDLRLGGPDGISLFEAVKSKNPDLQALVLTAYGTVEDAVRAMKAGAYDFLSKPIELERLEVLVEKALEKVNLAQENRELREVVKTTGVFDELVGESEPIQKVKEIVLKVASSKATVLILGESGTGKEVVARAIHRASSRKGKPFTAVSCAALPEALVESELFGHERGAFTGAIAEKKGRFELADGGTIFLDEVGDIPLSVQVKLLTVIQSGCFERVGSNITSHVDVRIIAATHRNLEERIQQGLFREDLFYRMNVVAIRMPPLRERKEDIPLLVNHFLKKYTDLTNTSVEGVDEKVLQHLFKWPFPGNVRELENWIERAVVLAEEKILTESDFPAQLSEPVAAPTDGKREDGLEEQVACLETRLIQEAMTRNKGNKSAAARDLKITERAIRYKLNKYNL